MNIRITNQVVPISEPSLPSREKSTTRCFDSLFHFSCNSFEFIRKKRAWASVRAGNAILDNIGSYNLPEEEREAIFYHMLNREKEKLKLFAKVKNFHFSVENRMVLAANFRPKSTHSLRATKLKDLLTALVYLDLGDRLILLLDVIFENNEIEQDSAEYTKKLILFAEYFEALKLSQEGRLHIARNMLNTNYKDHWNTRVYLFLEQLNLYKLDTNALLECLQLINEGAKDVPLVQMNANPLYHYALKLEKGDKGAFDKIVEAAQTIRVFV